MNATNQVKSKMMRAAWSDAKQAAAKFGGKASDYIAETMRFVWAKAKEECSIKLSSIKVSLKDFNKSIKASHVKVVKSLNVVDTTIFEFCKAQVLGLIG